MGFFKRLFGICATKAPRNAGCWTNQINQIEIDPGRAPELSAPGGAIRLEGQGLPHRILVIRGDDGQPYAFVNKCTHGGRRLDTVPGTSTVQCCSIGKSTFNYQGEALSGSAKDPITTLSASETSGKIIVSLI